MKSTPDCSQFDYLRRRPFLVVETYVKPGNRVRTERKDWMKNRLNLDIDRQPYLTNRISDGIMRRATIIIDVANDTVVKNRLRATAEAFDDEILAHCKREYSSLFDQAQWGMR